MNTREEEEQVDQFLIHDLFYWIGLSDLATEGSYVWAESHAVAEYTNWAADQPGGDTSQQEHTCNTAPLRHVNIEVACLDKPSKPRCRQASYEPGMGC